MPQRSFQITPQQVIEAIIPVSAGEQDFFSFTQRRRGEELQRLGIDYQSGVLSFAAYEQALKDDLAQINPDNPRYNETYATLLAVRENRQRMQDAEMVDRYERGIMPFSELEQYFIGRLRETAAETPEFYGLTQKQREEFMVNLDRNFKQLQTSWQNGEIGVSEYVEGLQNIRSQGGFVENSPVAVALRGEITSAKLQDELNKLEEEFSLAQGDDLLGYIDRLNEIKSRFHPGTPLRADIFGLQSRVLGQAYQQFTQLEARGIQDIFGQAKTRAQLFSELGETQKALDTQAALFGMAERTFGRQPLTLRQFAEERPTLSSRLEPFRIELGKAPSVTAEELRKFRRENVLSTESAATATLRKIKSFSI